MYKRTTVNMQTLFHTGEDTVNRFFFTFDSGLSFSQSSSTGLSIWLPSHSSNRSKTGSLVSFTARDCSITCASSVFGQTIRFGLLEVLKVVLIAVHMPHNQTQQAIQVVQYTGFRSRIVHHLGNEVSFTGSLVCGACVFLRNRLGHRCIGQLWFEVYRVLAVLMACHRAFRP